VTKQRGRSQSSGRFLTIAMFGKTDRQLWIPIALAWVDCRLGWRPTQTSLSWFVLRTN